MRRRRRPDKHGRRPYYIRFEVKGKRTYFDLGPDKDAAAAKGEEILIRHGRAIARIAQVSAGKVKTVRQLCDTYLTERKPELTPGYHASLTWLIRALCDFEGTEGPIGDLTVDDAKAEHLQEFLETRRVRGWSLKTVQHATTAAKSVMRWAEDRDRIAKNPWRIVKAKRPPRIARRVLSPAEVEEVVKAGLSPRSRLLFELLYLTAARPSELVRAKWSEVDLVQRQIVRLEHKTARYGKPRVIHLPKRAVELLKGIQRASSPLVFPGRNGKVLDSSAIRHAFNRAKAALPPAKQEQYADVTPYTFRHSRATHLIQNGVDPATVAAILGNTPSMVLDRYAWPAAAHVRKALEL